MRRALPLLVCAILCFAPFLAQAAAELRIGILAQRPAAEMEKQWSVLAPYLSSALEGRPVRIEAFDYDELDALIDRQALDFFLTNPSHYIALRGKAPLSGALLTLLPGGEHEANLGLGGVIFSRAQSEIYSLADLPGKRIAAIGTQSLGGHQAQLMTLHERGLPVPPPGQIDFLGTPHDRVVKSVLEGSHDVGFVRSDVLEAMAAEGRLDLAEVRILNPQSLPNYPYALSTRLYPHWALVASARVDARTSQRIAAALLLLEADSEIARSLGIRGFSVAAEYEPIENLMRTLRLPPFDYTPTVSLHSVWMQYRPPLLLIGLGLLLLCLGFIYLVYLSRRLSHANQGFARLIADMPAAIVVIHNEHIIDCNSGALSLLGYSDKNALLQSPVALSPPVQPDGEDSARKAQRILRSLNDQNRQQFEWLHHKADGSEILVDVTLIRSELDGKPVVLGVWHDITERVATARALDEARRRLQATLDALPDMLFEVDEEWRFLSVHTAQPEKLLMPPTDFLGQPLEAILPPSACAEILPALEEARLQGRSQGHGYTLEMEGKTQRYTLSVVRKPGDETQVASYICLVRNITELHHALLQQQEATFLLEAAIKNSPAGIIVADTSGRILHANQAALQLARVPADTHAVSDPLSDSSENSAQQSPHWEILYPNGQPCPTEDYPLSRALSKGERSLGLELILRDHAGRRRWVNANAAPILNAEGQLSAAITIFHDITERKESELALRRSTAELDRYFTQSLDLLCIVSTDGRFERLNPEWEKVLGYHQVGLEGAAVLDFVHPEDQVATQVFFEQAAQHPGAVNFETRMRHRNGGYRWIEWRCSKIDRQIYAAARDVSDRKHSEENLRRERDLFSAGPVVVLTWAPEEHWPVRQASTNCEAILGYSAQELMAEDFRFAELFHPEARAQIEAELQQAITNGQPRLEQSYRLRTKNGNYIWFYDFTQLIRNENGTIREIRGYLVDQSQQKQLELDLANERMRLANILWGTGVGTWEWNVRTGETRFNQRWAELIGYSLEEIYPTNIETWTRFAHPDDLQRSEKLLQRHFSGETEFYECEARMRHRKGHWIWVVDRGRVVSRGPDGAPEWMVGTHTDITARKQAEAAREEAIARLERLAAHVPGALFQFRRFADQHYSMPFASGNLREIFDVTPEQVRNDFSPILARIHPDDRDLILRSIEESATQLETWRATWRVQRADGFHWLEGESTPEPLADGSVVWHGFVQDITERKAVEQALEDRRNELERSNTELEQFAYIASHDLRQPLRMITSYVQMLGRRLSDKLDDDTAKMMGFVTEGSTRMDQMLTSLLEYSRVGRIGAPMAAIDSGACAAEAIRFLGPSVADRAAQIELPAHWPQVMASRDELTRLFQNLIGNAIKYCRPGQAPKITLGVESKGARWEFVVRDQGIGIDPAQFERLFRVFQRLHARSEYEGTGIGLAICRKIVERHGGRIWVESAGEDQGSAFHFTLPAASQAPDVGALQ